VGGVDRLAARGGYSTVLQDWDFRPGRDWVHEMQTAIAHARRTIAVLSGDYLQSVHGEAEWRAAYAEDPTGEAGRCFLCSCGSARRPASSVLVSGSTS
jgi:TIR domain